VAAGRDPGRSGKMWEMWGNGGGGPLGCQGWVVIPQNVKKVKITAP